MSGDNNASSHHSVKAEPYVFPSSAILVYVDFKNVSHFRTSLLSSNNALDLLYSVGECGILASDVAAKSSLRTSSIQGVRPAASQDDFTTGDLQPLVQLLGGMPCDFAEREARLYQVRFRIGAMTTKYHLHPYHHRSTHIRALLLRRRSYFRTSKGRSHQLHPFQTALKTCPCAS